MLKSQPAALPKPRYQRAEKNTSQWWWGQRLSLLENWKAWTCAQRVEASWKSNRKLRDWRSQNNAQRPRTGTGADAWSGSRGDEEIWRVGSGEIREIEGTRPRLQSAAVQNQKTELLFNRRHWFLELIFIFMVVNYA